MLRNDDSCKKFLSVLRINPVSVYVLISTNDFTVDEIVALHELFSKTKNFQADIRLFDPRSRGKSGSLYSLSVIFLVSLTWVAKKILSPTLELIGKKLAKAVDKVFFDNKKKAGRKKKSCEINIRISIEQNIFDIYLEPENILHGIPERKRLMELLFSEHKKQQALAKRRSARQFIVYNSKLKKWELE